MLQREKTSPATLSEFLTYLAEQGQEGQEQLPPLAEMSQQLGVSVASLREQLEVARALGLVEVRPRTGIRRMPYRFEPAVLQSLSYAVAVDPANFQAYSDMRIHLEMAYWYKATSMLTPGDIQILRNMVSSAKEKMRMTPVQIPHIEHRELHLTIYRRLGNPFVTGALEAYWEVYEAIGLNVYTDLNYLENVWKYHERMVESIAAGDLAGGYQAMVDHNDLLFHRPRAQRNQKFE